MQVSSQRHFIKIHFELQKFHDSYYFATGHVCCWIPNTILLIYNFDKKKIKNSDMFLFIIQQNVWVIFTLTSSNVRYPGSQMFHICINSVGMFAGTTNTP